MHKPISIGKVIVDISKGIQCGGFHFDVVADQPSHRSLRANNNNGECDCNNKLISLDCDMDAAQFSKTFIHEVIEAVNNVYCNDELEHPKIQQLSYGIHQVMESLGVRFGYEKGR